MRIVADRRSLKRVLWWAERAFFAAAVSAFGYCAFVFVDALTFGRRASPDLEQQRQSAQSRPHPNATPPEVHTTIGPDGLIGRIEISRLHLSAIIIQGTETQTLRRAVGHIASTALPGWPGNVGLAAHRDTLFR